jgi:hypothetical protein
MSIIKADLIQDKAGATHPLVTKADFVKAWAQYTSAASSTLNDSFAISALTDNGTGAITLDFTNPFSSALYVGAGFSNTFTLFRSTVTAQLATAMAVVTANSAGTSADASYNGVMWSGDLA